MYSGSLHEVLPVCLNCFDQAIYNGFIFLISCIPVNNDRFTQKCDCFQNHSWNFFISLAYYEVDKNKWQNVNRRLNHEHILMKQNFSGIFFSEIFQNFSSAPLKTSSPCAYGHWSKSHVNIINSSGVMTIFFYKGLEIERNTETGSALVWSEFSSISGDSGELRIPNLARMSLIKCY